MDSVHAPSIPALAVCPLFVVADCTHTRQRTSHCNAYRAAIAPLSLSLSFSVCKRRFPPGTLLHYGRVGPSTQKHSSGRCRTTSRATHIPPLHAPRPCVIAVTISVMHFACQPRKPLGRSSSPVLLTGARVRRAQSGAVQTKPCQTAAHFTRPDVPCPWAFVKSTPLLFSGPLRWRPLAGALVVVWPTGRR